MRQTNYMSQNRPATKPSICTQHLTMKGTKKTWSLRLKWRNLLRRLPHLLTMQTLHSSSALLHSAQVASDSVSGELSNMWPRKICQKCFHACFFMYAVPTAQISCIFLQMAMMVFDWQEAQTSLSVSLHKWTCSSWWLCYEQCNSTLLTCKPFFQLVWHVKSPASYHPGSPFRDVVYIGCAAMYSWSLAGDHSAAGSSPKKLLLVACASISDFVLHNHLFWCGTKFQSCLDALWPPCDLMSTKQL